MPERAPRVMAAVLTLALAGVVAIGLATAEPRPADRTEELASRLRCPQCLSQSVADSPSESAEAMRAVIRELVDKGHSDDEILTYFTARYGEWVLLDAPPRGRTLALWVAPAVVLAIGVAAIAGLRRPARSTS